MISQNAVWGQVPDQNHFYVSLIAGISQVPERFVPCWSKLCENRDVERYAAVIHGDPEGGFWAEVPALPGCYSQGETVDELMENIREAITGVLEVMREQGKRPEPNIQIPDVAV